MTANANESTQANKVFDEMGGAWPVIQPSTFKSAEELVQFYGEEVANRRGMQPEQPLPQSGPGAEDSKALLALAEHEGISTASDGLYEWEREPEPKPQLHDSILDAAHSVRRAELMVKHAETKKVKAAARMRLIVAKSELEDYQNSKSANSGGEPPRP